MINSFGTPFRRLLVITIGCALFAVGCGSSDSKSASTKPAADSADNPSAEASPATDTRVAAADDAAAEPEIDEMDSSEVADPKNTVTPVFLDAKTINDEDFDVATLQGKPVVAWFWAPWCSVCRGEADTVEAAAARFGDRVTFVGVAGRGEADEMREFVEDTGVTSMTHLNDTTGEMWTEYDVLSQPAFAFINADGSASTIQGVMSLEEIEAEIDQLTT